MKEKIQTWLKSRENKLLLCLIVFAAIIRLYYFILTKDQPLWWDEADYLNMTKYWTLGLYYDFLSVRPILFSMILVPLLKISNTEILPRLLMNLLSLSAVVGTYYLGKEIYDYKTGLLAGFFMAIFSFGLFFSERLLVDIPSLAFFTFAALFFYLYFSKNNKKYFYLAAIITGLGTLIRLQTALILFVVLVYVISTEKLNFIKKKEYWISAFIFILILLPYIIWGYMQFNVFILTEAGKFNAAQSNVIGTGFSVLSVYIQNFSNYIFAITDSSLGFIALIFLAALLIIYGFNVLLGFDLVFNNKNSDLKNRFFLLLLFLIPLILTSFMIAHNEDRYILNAFPGLFVILAYFTVLGFEFIKKKNRSLALLIILLFILTIGYAQLSSADALIKYKSTSYSQVKDAGLFIKTISNKNDVAISNSMLQVEFYSEIKVLGIPAKKEDFESKLLSEKPKYLILSAFESLPEWLRSYPQEKNLTAINVFFMDSAKTQPVVVVYKFN